MTDDEKARGSNAPRRGPTRQREGSILGKRTRGGGVLGRHPEPSSPISRRRQTVTDYPAVMPLPYQSLPSLQTAAIDPLFSLGGEDDAELTPTERSPHPPLESGSSSSSLANTGGPSAVRSEGRRLRPDEMNIRPYSDDDLGIVTGTSGTQLRSVSPLAWGLKSTTASRELGGSRID